MKKAFLAGLGLMVASLGACGGIQGTEEAPGYGQGQQSRVPNPNQDGHGNGDDRGNGGRGQARCDLANGLFGYYPFEGDINDVAGKANIFHQSEVGPGDQGPASFDKGESGQGLKVGGCSGFYCFGHNIVGDGAATHSLFAGDFTVSTWVRADRPSSWDQFGILRKPGVIQLRRWTDGNRVQVLLGSDASPTIIDDNSGIRLHQGQWHHVVVFRRAGVVGVRVDGKGTASANYDARVENDAPLYFARYESGYPWEGTVDELGLWTAGLSDPQIGALYNGASPAVHGCDNCDLARGMRAQYRFEGNLNDSAGMTSPLINESVGAGDRGPASFTVGKLGQALQVGGCTGFYCYGHNVYGDASATRTLLDGDFGISTWVKQDRSSPWDQNAILSREGVLRLRRWAYTGRVQALFGSDSSPVTVEDNSGVDVGDGNWHHVYVFRKGATVGVRVDGVGSSVGAFSGAGISDKPLNVAHYETGYPWEGEIDELTFFGSALSEDELSRVYNAGNGTVLDTQVCR